MTKEELITRYRASRFSLSKRVQNASVSELAEFTNWEEYQQVIYAAKALEEHGYADLIDQL